MSLPNQLNYSQTISELPQCTTYEVTLVPTTGAGSYSSGSTIKFDFQNRGFIDPQSIMLRYSYAVTSLVGAQIKATPAYSPWLRLETLIGSQIVESINQYNQTVGFLHVNTQYDVATKYGSQSALGFYSDTTSGDMTQMDGRVCAVNETGSFSCPLVGMLYSSNKLIPAFAMPTISVQLTMDQISSIFTTSVVPTAFTVSNVELSYNMLDFGREVEQSVLSMPKLYLKAWSYTNSAVSTASGLTGQISLVYNQKLASIKGAYIIPSGSASINTWGDSIDMTVGNGDYSLVVAGQVYPQRSLNTKTNKAYIIQELRKASGNITDRNNNMCINSIEFNATSATATLTQPAKFIIGIPLEKLHLPDDKAILSGISSNNSNITVNINTATATATSNNVNLILNYDCIIEVDTMNKDARVRQ